MIPFAVDYASPSVFDAEPDRAILGLSANRARTPVRFRGRVARHLFPFRIALRALGEAIWSNDSWWSDEGFLDPVVTLHPDQLLFEAFSQDQSVYVRLAVDPDIFETEGEVRHGTTNVDFSAWLWGAVGEMRSSRHTWLGIDPEGVELTTVGAGGRFEQKVEIPEPWLQGFLQLQAAMTMPGIRLRVRPVDLLAAIRYLRFTKAKVSPRALRYELLPGEEARLILEPWEKVVPLRGCDHGRDEERIIRTWGRRRLRLIEPLLPFAERVDIYLKGRALPSYYAVKLPGMTFLLGLSGWTARRFSAGGLELLGELGDEDPADLARARALLVERRTLGVGELAGALPCDSPLAARLLARLCRQGLALHDLEEQRFRHRELLDEPLDEARLFPPDPRRLQADRWRAAGQVEVGSCQIRETRKVKKLKTPDGPMTRELIFCDWHVSGRVADADATEIVINDHGRIIFGTCGCAHFKEHLLNQGPCAHMLALFDASADRRREGPTSLAADADTVQAPTAHRRGRTDDNDDVNDDDVNDNDNDDVNDNDDGLCGRR